MYYSTIYQSPIGTITIACNANNLVGLWIEGQKYHGGTLSEEIIEKDDISLFYIAKKWLDRYFEGKNPSISELPLAPIGGEFRQRVWQILCGIPYGKVITYGDIAKQLKCRAAQAVGGAVGHNPISIMIPCHRVVGSNGSLTGFSAGVKTKIKLLELEGVDMSRLFVPMKGTAL